MAFHLSDIAFSLSGKKAIFESRVVHGKKLKFVFTFYNKSSFEKDMQDWLDYQVGKYAHLESTQEVEGFKKYKGARLGRVSYQEFVQLSVPFLCKILERVFEENPDMILADTAVHIKIARFERWSGAQFTDAFPFANVESVVRKSIEQDLLDLSSFFVCFSGIYILQAIVGPQKFLGRIDYQFMYKYLAHELQHYHDMALGRYKGYFGLERALKKKMASSANYSLLYLTLALSDLRSEGIAEYRKSRNAPRIKYDAGAIVRFESKLEQLVSLRKLRAIDEYYQSELYAGSNDGVYYCGFMMCYIIAYGLEPSAFSRNEYLAPPSSKSYNQALSMISGSDELGFIKLYESACNRLGIRERVVRSAKVRRLLENASRIFDAQERAKIRAAGYYA